MTSILESYMHQQGTVIKLGAPDAYGKRAQPEQIDTPCRVMQTEERLKLADGTLLTVKLIAQVPADVDAAVGDGFRVDGDDADYQVKEVVRVPDIDGNVDHQRLLLQ